MPMPLITAWHMFITSYKIECIDMFVDTDTYLLILSSTINSTYVQVLRKFEVSSYLVDSMRCA